MSDTPRTNTFEHNMGSIVDPHYVVDVEVAQGLERELAEAKEQLRLCNVDQWTTAAELAAAIASFSEERERAQREGARVIKLQVELAEAQAEIVRECIAQVRKDENGPAYEAAGRIAQHFGIE
jgi:urease accessory protein UreF